MPNNLLILGSGEVLESASRIAVATLSDWNVQVVELTAPDKFNFELPDLAAYPAESWMLFVALDDRGLNMSRVQLIAAIKGRGYKLQRLVDPGADVAPAASLGENALIERGAVVGHGSKLGLNVFVGARAQVGDGCTIGNSVFIYADALLENGCQLGDYVTVGGRAVVESGTKVGRYSELRRPLTYKGDIPPKTFYLEIFENPVRIIAPL